MINSHNWQHGWHAGPRDRFHQFPVAHHLIQLGPLHDCDMLGHVSHAELGGAPLFGRVIGLVVGMEQGARQRWQRREYSVEIRLGPQRSRAVLSARRRVDAGCIEPTH
jgi:hypothetical protein